MVIIAVLFDIVATLTDLRFYQYQIFLTRPASTLEYANALNRLQE